MSQAVRSIMKLQAISLVLLLAACAAGTPRELKSTPSKKVSVRIEQNYQKVYKNLLDKAQECLGEGTVSGLASMHIKNVLLSDLKEAEISYMMTNLGNYYYFHSEIKGIGSDATQYDAYVALSTWESMLDRSVVWAEYPNSDCKGAIK